MLSRYTIYRSKPAHLLPQGRRMDKRKHTRHILRPPADLVLAYLDDPSPVSFERFASAYRQTLEERYAENRAAFDELAELATEQDVCLGCSCPTRKQPRIDGFHNWLALRFMQAHYPDLDAMFPPAA
jgi:uncharacterized protein YeaO (DUF488 family)